MSETMQAIDLLENTIRTMIQKMRILEKENELLGQKVDELKQLVSVQNKDSLLWKDKYHSLVIAKTLQGSIKNTNNVKLTISNLIKEIDTCIAQLNP